MGGKTYWPLVIVLLQLVSVDNRAHFLAQTAVDALALVHHGIPKTFDVGLESDGVVGADVTAGVAAATLSFVSYGNHL